MLHVIVGLGFGGAEKVMAEIVSTLDASRFDVSVLALKSGGPWEGILKSRGIPVATLDGRSLLDPALLLRASRFFRTRSFDIIHSHLTWADFLAALFKRHARLVWHDHDTGESLPFSSRSLERLLIPRSDVVIAVSRSVQERLKARCPVIGDRIRILPNSILFPPQDQLSHVPSEVFRIGFVGRIDDPKKGLSILLRAAAAVARVHAGARFVMVGDGPAADRLKRLSSSLGLEKSVEWLPARTDVWSVYRSLDLFVLPSLWEGFGIALLEAMGCGLPVVASRVGGIPEVVIDRKTGILVPPGNAEALADAILEMIRDPEIRRSMGDEARRHARTNFDMTKRIAELESIYRSLLDSPDIR